MLHLRQEDIQHGLYITCVCKTWRCSYSATLCIPTAFCSYTGEALDQKTPLLRSMQAINEQSLRLLRLFGNTTAKKVIPSVGPEQECFLVDGKIHAEKKT